MGSNTDAKPSTHQADLAKLPRALAPLIERPQWAVWRWTQQPNGSWQKPPFMATQPDRHASTKDPSTWSDYATALATVQAGHADGISYILTEDDPFRRDRSRSLPLADTHSIDAWAQNFLRCRPSIPIRKSRRAATAAASGVWRRRCLEPQIHARDRRQADRGRAVPAHQQGAHDHRLHARSAIRELANIDRVLDWAVVWGERRKAAAAAARASDGNGFEQQRVRLQRSIRSSRSCVRGTPAGPTAATVSIRSSAIMSAAAGTLNRYLRTCSNTRRGSAGAICVKIGCTKRLPAVPANMPSRSCRCRR